MFTNKINGLLTKAFNENHNRKFMIEYESDHDSDLKYHFCCYDNLFKFVDEVKKDDLHLRVYELKDYDQLKDEFMLIKRLQNYEK